MSKHRHEVERKIREEKERQLEPVQRRYMVRQKAAEHEIVQVLRVAAVYCNMHAHTWCL